MLARASPSNGERERGMSGPRTHDARGLFSKSLYVTPPARVHHMMCGSPWANPGPARQRLRRCFPPTPVNPPTAPTKPSWSTPSPRQNTKSGQPRATDWKTLPWRAGPVICDLVWSWSYPGGQRRATRGPVLGGESACRTRGDDNQCQVHRTVVHGVHGRHVVVGIRSRTTE